MEHKKNIMISFIKKEAVLTVALLLAFVSAFLVKPSMQYVSYLDFRVLVLLFSLMLVVSGFQSLGVFRMLGERLCSYVKSLRHLTLVLVGLCFSGSMLITNDVSLITFIPFTLSVFAMIDCEDRLIPVIVLETIAANLGSMLTPIGNPQNLLLFSMSGMTVGTFILYMFPLTLLSFVLIVLCVLKLPDQPVTMHSVSQQEMTGVKQNRQKDMSWRFWIYVILFVVCLGNVFHLYSYWVVGAVVAVVVFLVNRQLFKKVDYSLLLTFIGFFIFIGNMKQMDAINHWILGMIKGNELLAGILVSQVISNVPAAMLLSGFTTDYRALLYGVNIGGLGTLIASMASLISYRCYVKEYPSLKRKYFQIFTKYNIFMLIIMYIIYCVVSKVIL